MLDRCVLCRKPAEMIYEVERGNPKLLCGSCFGRWTPKELDALLGVKPPYEYVPMSCLARTSVLGSKEVV